MGTSSRYFLVAVARFSDTRQWPYSHRNVSTFIVGNISKLASLYIYILSFISLLSLGHVNVRCDFVLRHERISDRGNFSRLVICFNEKIRLVGVCVCVRVVASSFEFSPRIAQNAMILTRHAVAESRDAAYLCMH